MRLAVQLDSSTLIFHGPHADEAYPWLLEVGAVREEARVGNGRVTETANTTVAIENRRGKAEAMLDMAMRRRATLYDHADRVFFDGIIQSITPGRELILTIEA